jgi:hypothetical protein
MRKNKTLRFLFVLIANLLLFNNITIAMPVDSTTARKVATNFYNWKSGRSVDYNHAQLVYTQQIPSQGAVMQTSPATALYVFDFGGHFVMTSADTRVTPVLAYSTESGFDADGIAESIGWFLDEYVQEIEFITRTMSDSECEETASAWNRLVSGEMSTMATATNIVGPLISTTWNQSSPYNSFCPSDPNGHGGHAFAGCVACAMAQLIRHWEYPSTGIGSHSYEANFAYLGYGDYGTQSVNFSTANYNYSLMPLTLNGASQAQINEVAKLMYHCGVSVEMMYGPYGSGASDYAAVTALQNYFGFEGAELKTRGNDAASWTAMIKNELNNLRPVYYSGQGTGGHAFICDGYDDQNLFHFNWGWGGLYDGFFTLSNLNPGNDNFSTNQIAIIGIDASQPKIHCATNSLAFLSEANSYSATKSLIVVAAQLSDYIIAEVSGNFRISNNGTNFYTSRTLNTNGGTLYVRYQPTAGSGTEHGMLILRSGSIRDTVLLTGAIYNNTPYCLPPANLSISSQNLQDINLQWETPTVAPDPHTLTWSPSNPSINYGSGSNYQMTMLQRYCDTDLVAYHNQALTSISFIPDGDATLFRLVVYKGGNNDGGFNPGTLVVSQNVSLSSLQMDTWNTVTLNTPVVVDATQELWFGVYIEAPGGTYCLPLSNNSVPKKGSILGMHSTGSVSWSELYTSRSFCIRGTVENVQTVTSYQVSRNGTSLGTTTATHFQDHLSGTSTNTYTVTANWSNGCSASVQRTFTNVTNITATPEVLDFFSNHGFGTLVKTFIVGGSGLTGTIQATVSGNFLISVNGTSYSTSVSLPSSGGTVYVKYTPATPDGEYETGLVTLTSGNLSATVSLSGQTSDECNPPQNLTIAQSGNNIVLGWNEPVTPSIQQYNLSWLNDLAANFSIGTAIQHYFVQRFETSDLAPYHGKKLTSISFVPYQTATTYKLVVYQGGGLRDSYYLQSGTKILEQNVNLSTLTSNTWNTIQLDQPVTIDASQELWFGIYMEAPAGGYPIRLGTPYVAKKGLIMKHATYPDNTWYELGNGGYSYCFALKATIEDVPVLLTNYQIDRNEELAGTTGNTSYTDPVIYNDEYNYTVWAVWSNGCKAPARDVITVSGLCDPAGGSFTETACESLFWGGATRTQSGEYTSIHYDNNGCPISDTLHLTIYHGTHNVVTETACESFVWHGTTYTSSGTYNYNYTNEHGCHSNDILHLTVNHGTHNVETKSACDSYVWHGVTYTESGTYIYEYTNASGCPSADTLHLTISYSNHTDFTAVACEEYIWNSETFIQSGNYTRTFTNIHGCDSVVTLHLTIHHGTFNEENQTACESYTWHGTTYTTSGIYTYNYTNEQGCVSQDVLILTINYGTHNVETKSACDSYVWHGVTRTESGTYIYEYTNPSGCPSADTLHLTVSYSDHVDFTAVACEEYSWNNETFSESGNYTRTFTNTDGCDSVVTLHLTVHHGTFNEESQTACESYTWHGTKYTVSGTYTYNYTNEHGCSSQDVLYLTVNYGTHNIETEAVCDSYEWHGETYTESGTYTYDYTNASGCASTDTLHLTVSYSDHVDFTAVACEEYTWNNETFSESGDYTRTFTNTDGCDSVVTLHLTVHHGTFNEESHTACESYTWHGTTYTTSGVYTYDYTNEHGCVSQDVLILTVNRGTHNVESESTCDSYEWHGETYTESGTYTYDYTNAVGCASTDTLHLTIWNSDHIDITAFACEEYTWNNETFIESGNFTRTFTNVDGCDSVVTLHLTIHHGTFNEESQTACESYTWHGSTYTVSGIYTYDYSNEHGCESQDVLHLTVNYGTHNVETKAVCNSFVWHGETHTESGTYVYEYTNANGCASADTLHLTVNSSYTTPISAAICEGGSYNFFGQNLTTAGTYTHTLQTIHGCDSVISLTLTVNDVINTPITAEICEGGSYNFFGQTLATAGTYTHTLQSVLGCDSVITLTLTVNPVFNTPISAEICNGGSYNFFGQTLTTAGTYTHTLQSIHGCDSVITLTLTVNPVFNTPISAEICDGGNYNFFGQNLTTAGTYTHTLQSVHGCDSVITLTLTVNPVFNTPISAAICEGGNYNFFGQTLTTAGTYTHTLQTVHGCDSVITLTLTVNPVFNTPISTEICEGDSYNFFGQTLTTAGTYTHTQQSVHGCDSVISLTLTVNDVINTPITAEICEGGSYNFFGQNLTAAGTYTHTLQTIHGCDSVITLTLTVNPIFNTPISAEICEGGSYNFFGQNLTTAGTYSHTLQTVNGCDSVISLTLTVNPIFNTPISAEICEGGSYNFFGQTITTAGTYTHTLQSVHGCDSVITLTLTVNPVFNTPISAEICNGGSYNFFGQNLTTAGTYSHTLQSIHGCDSVISLMLTVNPVFNTPITAEICEGGSYSFFGQNLTTAGTYTHTLQSVHGCDSVITLTLTVNDVINTPITAEICEGGSYNFFGQNLTSAGTYTHTLQSIHGCDSVITLTLAVNPVYNTPLTAEICDGGSYNFFGQILTTAGSYTHTLQSVHGCDSVISLTLTVNPVFNTPISAEICEGGSYNFFGQNLTTAGTYSHTLQSVHGCDSVITLTLTVNSVFNTPISAEICEGGSYIFFGQTLTTAGTYNHTLQSVHGCDSVIALTLTVNPVFNTPLAAEICEGSSYEFFGQQITTAGTYTHTLQSVNGCDSVIALTLTVNPVFNTPLAAEICEGSSYEFFGQTITTAGTYSHTLQSVNGCDSVISLTLTVNPVFNTPISAEICNGGSYNFFGQTITTAGTYTHTLQTVHGCDSVITLTLTVNDVINTPVTAAICEGSSYDFFGQNLTTAGTYSHTLQSIHGCDSVISLTLTVNPVFNTPISAEICDGGSYDFFGQQITTAGTYTHTLQSVHGCDSVISLTLTVNPVFNTPLAAEICEGSSYNFFGQNLTTTGTYSHTLQSIHGCDSVISLTLTVNPVFNTPISAEICEGSNYDFFGQTITTAGTYTHTLQTVHGCDSVISLMLTVNDVINTPITAAICEGGSYNFFGQTLTTAGTYTHTLQSVHGCDSVITLTLTVNPVFNTPISAEICEGGSYNFFGQNLTSAGTYTHTLQSVHGCDSVITLTLTVNPVFNTPISAEICEGGSYNFFGQTLTTAGTYTHTLQTVNGCDSVITLTLTVNPVFNTPVTAEICEGGSYSFFGQNLTTAGTYTHTLQTIHGCDSVITLTLTVNPVFNTPVTAEICEGGSYNFFGQTITTAGTYTHTLQSVHGCDSVISLTLTVNPVFNTPITAAICEGGSYSFFGQNLTTAGTYTHTLQTIHGCDSVITLTLTVNDVINTPITAAICDGGSYNFFGQNLTTAGTYSYTLQSVHGCDSVISLTLTILSADSTDFTEVTCDSYTWNGTTYTTSGDYPVTLTNANGCDSVVTLHLTINPSFDITVYDTAVRLHEYTLGDFQITPEEAGTFTYDLAGTTAAGCDSTVHLILTVLNNDGIPVFETANVEIFPNPAHALLNIKGENMRRILIYNTDGQIVYFTDENINDLQQVDVSRYAPGQYFVKIIFNNKQSVTKKVVVNRK